MDFTGTFLGLLTIPMVLINVSAVIAGVVMVGRGDGRLVLFGAAVFVAGIVVSALVKGSSSGLTRFARAAMFRNCKALGIAAGLLDSMLPLVIVSSCEIAALALLREPVMTQHDVALWLWSYGVVTGIRTFRAWHAKPQDQTLTRIQAYSTQLGYAIVSLPALMLNWSLAEAAVLIAIPMLLPLTVGFFIAIADRDALRDVQI